MKKFTAILLALLVCASLSISLFSCEKENKDEETTAGESENVGEEEEGGEEAAE